MDNKYNSKVTYKGTPQTGKNIAYVSPDMLEHTMATLFLERYRPILIPRETSDEKNNNIRNGLIGIVNGYDSGSIKEIKIMPAKNISTTDQWYADANMHNFSPESIQKYSIDDTVLDFGIHSLHKLKEIFDTKIMEQKLYIDYHLIE
jgi:hypothetical protein